VGDGQSTCCCSLIRSAVPLVAVAAAAARSPSVAEVTTSLVAVAAATVSLFAVAEVNAAVMSRLHECLLQVGVICTVVAVVSC